MPLKLYPLAERGSCISSSTQNGTAIPGLYERLSYIFQHLTCPHYTANFSAKAIPPKGEGLYPAHGKLMFRDRMCTVLADVLAPQIGKSHADVFKAALMPKNDNEKYNEFMELEKLSTTQREIIRKIYNIAESIKAMSEYKVPEICEFISPSINLNLCRAKYGLSSFMANRAKESIDHSKQSWFQEKAQKYNEEAEQLYKDEIYEKQYASNPEREQKFISAQLEDNMGNPVPLGDFYRSLHQERKKERQRQQMIEAIKLQQEQIHKMEEDKLAFLESPDLKKIEIQKNADDRFSSSSSISTGESEEDSIWSQNNSQANEKYVPPLPKKKNKTRGEAKPPLEKAASNNADKETSEEPVTTRKLSPEHYATFQSLIGKSTNRNVSLASVKGLLGALQCTIQPGGSHGKASAPNGGAWAIPNKEWDGPIPPYYRHQLNDFIQNMMEIDPEDVVEG